MLDASVAIFHSAASYGSEASGLDDGVGIGADAAGGIAAGGDGGGRTGIGGGVAGVAVAVTGKRDSSRSSSRMRSRWCSWRNSRSLSCMRAIDSSKSVSS